MNTHDPTRFGLSTDVGCASLRLSAVRCRRKKAATQRRAAEKKEAARLAKLKRQEDAAARKAKMKNK